MVQKSVRKSNRRIGKKYRHTQKMRRLKREHRSVFRANKRKSGR